MNNINNCHKQINNFLHAHKIDSEIFFDNYQSAYLPLAKNISNKYHQTEKIKPLVVGINGAQGSGKTTLCELVSLILTGEFDLKVAVISIDDLYKTYAERLKLAGDIHPLLASRGVPGTHDIQLGIESFESLINSQEKSLTKIPRFSKANDDREPLANWSLIEGKLDIILFEGWCVASQPQADDELTNPINELEQQNDPDLVWRKFVNKQLAEDYQKLFSFIDYLIFLKAPDYDCVFDWRLQQEQQLIEKLKLENKSLSRTMNKKQLKFFMQHFERLTRHNLKLMPELSDCIILLDQVRNAHIIKG